MQISILLSGLDLRLFDINHPFVTVILTKHLKLLSKITACYVMICNTCPTIP